jgi:hypothetical protein
MQESTKLSKCECVTSEKFKLNVPSFNYFIFSLHEMCHFVSDVAKKNNNLATRRIVFFIQRRVFHKMSLPYIPLDVLLDSTENFNKICLAIH